MSGGVENALARQVATANALLALTLFEIRSGVAERIQSSCVIEELASSEFAPVRHESSREAIDENSDGIELIRQIEAHLGFTPCPGPAWFDEIVAQGPAWVEGVS